MSILQDLVVGVCWLALWAIEMILRLVDGDDDWPASRKKVKEYRGT